MAIKHSLYLGSDPTRFFSDGQTKVTHFPLLEIVPRSFVLPHLLAVLADWNAYSHLLLTSKQTVSVLSDALAYHGLPSPKKACEILAIGKTTASAIEQQGWRVAFCSSDERQEGILARLRLIEWGEESFAFLPRSSLARGSLETFFLDRAIRHQVCDLYDTLPREIKKWPDLEQFDEIFFTSPSTVAIFFNQIHELPKRPQLKAIGPVTLSFLRTSLCKIEGLRI
jgi:uroporphyrinogen-III synthase